MNKKTYNKLKTVITSELFKTDEDFEEIISFINDYIMFSDSKEEREKGMILRKEDRRKQL